MSEAGVKSVTRIACFKFKPTVTVEQKGDRTRAFLALYAEHEDLILEMPRGGKPLNTPLKLTNVKRDQGWDTGFIVKFKVCQLLILLREASNFTAERRGKTRFRR